ncbi:MAG: GNAT family N-acetyltransferase [Ilumatobacter fluminis]|uniref:GNAT family N-acetyltransferase n=1 Tax=Ilumatobacter fluminis TaxID=467091 RepID=UPI0032EED108
MTSPTATASVSVRPAETADEERRRSWFAETKRVEFAPLGLPEPTLAGLCDQQYDARVAGYSHQFPAAEHLVIELDGEPVGALIVDGLHEVHEAGTVVVVDIVIAEQHRHRGIGRRVLAEIVDTADRRGADVELTVAHGNPARRLYDRLGFRAIATTELHERLRRPPARKDTT